MHNVWVCRIDDDPAKAVCGVFARSNTNVNATEKLADDHADVTAFYNSRIIPAPNPKISTSNPTVNDDVDVGYAVGCLWVNTTTPSWWGCSDATTDNAVWTQLSA